MKIFFERFKYLFDASDRRNFVKFLGLLFFGGLLSLLGIGAVVPFVNVLINPGHAKIAPLIHHFGYNHVVIFSVVLLILAFWIKDLASFFVLIKQARFLSNLSRKIQERLFFCYIYSPYAYHVKRSSPELIANINVETSVLSVQVIGQFGIFLNECVTSGVIFVALLFVNFVFALCIVGSVLIVSNLFIRRVKKLTRYYGDLRAKNYEGLTQSVIQGLGAVRETKIYHKEGFFVDKFMSYTEGLARASAFSSIVGQSPRFLIEVSVITVVLILVAFFVLLGRSGSQIFLLLTIFGVAAVQLLPSMNRLMLALSSMRYGQASLRKIYTELKQYESFNLTAEKQTLKKDAAKLDFNRLFELKGINYAYDDVSVLQDLNLTITPGQKVAFVGASGAGKTTLVDVILGVLTPLSGEILVDGRVINQENLPQWQQHFGYIPQIIYLYNATVKENVAFGIEKDDIDDAQVWQALKKASLSDFVKDLPQGLDTVVGENGLRLSGGQRQRLGIARSLYHNPSVLVMDEATAALDNQTEAEVTKALACAEESRTIITIAHRLTTIKDYDVIFVLNKGKLLASGTYDELLVNSVDFAAMVNAAS